MSIERDRASDRLREALEMHGVGVALMRQNLRRRRPEASEDEIEVLLASWLEQRPGAEHGDAEGSPVDWQERLRRRS